MFASIRTFALGGILLVSLSLGCPVSIAGVVLQLSNPTDINEARAELAVDADLEDYLQVQQSFGGEFYNTGDGFLNSSELLSDGLHPGYGTTILYWNGMNTNRATFLHDVAALKAQASSYDAVPDAKLGFGLYNISGMQYAADHSAAICDQIVEGLWINDDSRIYQHCVAKLKRDGVRDEYTQIPWQYISLFSKFVFTDDYVDEDTVRYAADVVTATIGSGQRLIIVCHSQGCFYTRDTLREIAKTNPYTDKYFRSIGVLMLGSPVRESALPEGVRAIRISECNDIVTKAALITPCVRGDAGVSWFRTWVAKYSFPQKLINWNIKAHSFSQTYMSNYVVVTEVKAALRQLDAEIERPRTTFTSGNRVYASDNLNVRQGNGSLMYTVDANSLGEVFSLNTTLMDGYYRVSVKFDDDSNITLPDGRRSTIGAMPTGDQYGFVATGWLRYDLDHPSLQPPTNPLNSIDPIQYELLDLPDGEELSHAPPGTYTAYGLPYPSSSPDSNDELAGLGGCTECSTTAPSPFEIYYEYLSCYRGEPRVKLRWTPSYGKQKYQIFRDGGVLLGERTYTTYTDRNGLVPGEAFTYFIKAVNGDGSRNSDNAWRVEIPYTICGAPPPPPPYDGPVPIATTSIPLEVEMTTATVDSTINPNGLCASAYFEYGDSPAMGESTNPYSLGCGSDDTAFNWSIPVSCDKTVYYRVAAQHQYGVEYGSTMTFETPECTSEAPTELSVTHDVQNNALVLSWGEPLLPSSSVIKIELKILQDPRPGIETGVWSERPYQSAGVTEWKDEWLDPQPGGEYCYRVRTWNTATGGFGYSDFSNVACITVEGILVPQVEFPSAIEVRLSLGQGLTLMGVGGEGEFEVYRNINGGAFELITTLQSGDINFLDGDVIPGNTYCYQFVQNGVTSEEYCNTYLSEGQIGTPTLWHITRIDDTWVTVTFTSAVYAEGYFKIWNNYHMEGWISNGGTAVYTDSAMITKNVVAEAAYPACYKVEQYLNGISTGFSNELCLPIGQSDIEYVLPAPPSPPTDLQVNGASNPTGLPYSVIFFDAVFHDVDTEDTASGEQIQVSYDPSSWENPLWDSGYVSLQGSTVSGDRTSRIAYAGPPLSANTPVYWRIRHFDESGAQGQWSNESAMFSFEPLDPSLVSYWQMNGEIGSAAKTTDSVNLEPYSLSEFGGKSETGFDGGINGCYRLEEGPRLDLGEVYTPGSGPVSISLEVRNIVIPFNQATVLYAYSLVDGSYIAINMTGGVYSAKAGVTLVDSQGHYVSYSDGPNVLGGNFRRIDVNIYNGPNAFIELYINGVRYDTWPVYSDAPYNFTQDLQWVLGTAIQSNGAPYNKFFGDVDEVRVYNRIRNAEEILTGFQYSRQ